MQGNPPRNSDRLGVSLIKEQQVGKLPPWVTQSLPVGAGVLEGASRDPPAGNTRKGVTERSPGAVHGVAPANCQIRCHLVRNMKMPTATK